MDARSSCRGAQPQAAADRRARSARWCDPQPWPLGPLISQSDVEFTVLSSDSSHTATSPTKTMPIVPQAGRRRSARPRRPPPSKSTSCRTSREPPSGSFGGCAALATWCPASCASTPWFVPARRGDGAHEDRLQRARQHVELDLARPGRLRFYDDRVRARSGQRCVPQQPLRCPAAEHDARLAVRVGRRQPHGEDARRSVAVPYGRHGLLHCAEKAAARPDVQGDGAVRCSVRWLVHGGRLHRRVRQAPHFQPALRLAAALGAQ